MKSLMYAAVVASVGMATIATGQDISTVNGYNVEARLFNDFAATNLNINGTAYPAPALGSIAGAAGPVVINEQFAQGEVGNFANKHVAWLSNDGGASRFGVGTFQSWSLAFNVRIDAPAGAPRKEGGIEVWNPRPALGFTDQGQVLIASDGEVAVFGGSMPFTGFGGSTYTLGTTAQVIFEYFGPGVHDATKGAYRLRFIDAVTGLHDSGIKVWGVETDGTVGFNAGTNIGFKAQNQRNPFIPDSSVMTYSNISVVPAPGAFALMGLAGLVAGRRRR